MRSLVLLVIAIGLTGCTKKPKPTDASRDSASVPPKTPAPARAADKGDKTSAEKPNWLTDPRLKEKDGNQLPTENQPEKPNWGLSVQAPPPGNPPAGQPGANLPPVGNPQASGVLQPMATPPPAAGTTSFPKLKPVTEADMKEVWIFIENASGATGKMPTSALVLAALKQAQAAALPLVVGGSITLTGATTRESVWAYETKAKLSGGWVASQNGVENMTAAELNRRLGK